MWDNVFPSKIDLSCPMFTKIKQLDPELLCILLDISFNQNIIINSDYHDDPIYILKYWYENGLIDFMDFSSMYLANSNAIRIGSDAHNYYDYTKLIIPFKEDKCIHLCVNGN